MSDYLESVVKKDNGINDNKGTSANLFESPITQATFPTGITQSSMDVQKESPDELEKLLPYSPAQKVIMRKYRLKK